MLSYTFRITPTETKVMKKKETILTLLAHKQSKIQKLLLMREGGGDTKVHYHGIIKTSYKRQSIRNFIKKEFTTMELKGNEEYQFNDTAIEHQKKPSHAYNYVCKEDNIFIKVGFPIELIKKYQDDFKKAREAFENKKKDKIKVIIDKCKQLPKNGKWEKEAIRIILNEYANRKLLPPVGYQLQKIIGRIMMDLDLEEYIKTIQNNYRTIGFYYDPREYDEENQPYCHKCKEFHDYLEPCIIKYQYS